ncbi:MAG: FxsA family protein [Kiloniellales bacterium]
MGIFLLAAFIGVPILEIAVFIQVGGYLGLWPTLGLVVLTAVLGTWQLQAQGLATLMRARDQIDQGALPARELFDGACLLVAGALLLTPGFITDAAGFLLFLPPVRDFLRSRLARFIATRVETRIVVDGQAVPPDGGPIIDADYSDVTGEPRPGEKGPDENKPGPRRGLPR